MLGRLQTPQPGTPLSVSSVESWPDSSWVFCVTQGLCVVRLGALGQPCCALLSKPLDLRLLQAQKEPLQHGAGLGLRLGYLLGEGRGQAFTQPWSRRRPL